jgi:hypothetical protein
MNYRKNTSRVARTKLPKLKTRSLKDKQARQARTPGSLDIDPPYPKPKPEAEPKRKTQNTKPQPTCIQKTIFQKTKKFSAPNSYESP